MFSGLDHIDLVCEDPQRMAEFFVSLGFRKLGDIPSGGIKVQFPGGCDQPYLDLRPHKDSQGNVVKPLGLHHIALRCDNVNAIADRADELNLALKRAPYAGHTGRMLVTMTMPDGSQLQCAEYKPGWTWDRS